MARSPELTKKIMSRVKSTDTGPELKLRRALWARGLRYRLHARDLPGKPDLVFRREKIAVFCDGDFWHGHNWRLRGLGSLEEEVAGYTPYWREKILKNVSRDRAADAALADLKWLVLRFWASEIDKDAQKCAAIVEAGKKARLAAKKRPNKKAAEK
jgi:DNA mismatch endonuclease (patch repair protein)